MSSVLKILYQADQPSFPKLKMSAYSLLRQNRNLDIHVFSKEGGGDMTLPIKLRAIEAELKRVDSESKVTLHKEAEMEAYLREGSADMLSLSCDTLILGDLRNNRESAVLTYPYQKNPDVAELIDQISEVLSLSDIRDDDTFNLLVNKISEMSFEEDSRIPALQYQVVNHCNLNCVCCMTAAPLAKPYYADIIKYEKDVKKIAEMTGGEILQFGLLGGEPLLHPEVADFAVIAREYLPNTDIRIVTNMLLIKEMDDDFFRKVVRADIQFECSIYFPEEKFDYTAAFSFMKKKGIRAENIFVLTDSVRSFHNVSLSLNGKLTDDQPFHDCPIREFLSFKDGKIFHCPVAQNATHIKEYFSLKDEQLKYENPDTLDISSSTKEDLLNFIANPSPFCGYCDIKKKCSREPVPHRPSSRTIGEWNGEVWA